jgi:hypothetical protein
MITKKEVNYKIDWHSFNPKDLTSAEQEYDLVKKEFKVVLDRKHYFSMLRSFLLDIKNLGMDKIDDIFTKYNVHFVDIDDIERVNIDEPV